MIGSLHNRVYENMTNTPKPEIGMGATVMAYTDRYAGTIVEVFANGGFRMREDKWTRVDGNGMSEGQEYRYEPNPDGCEYVFKPVRSGKLKGVLREGGKSSGSGVLVGKRMKYHDFSF